MYRLALLRLAITLAAISLFVPAVAAAQAATSSLQPLTVTEKENEKSVQVTVGRILVVQLPSDPTTGYRWALPWDLGPLVGGRQKDTGNGLETFKFIAKDTGTVTLTLDYRHSWDNAPPERSFTVTVNVTPGEKCECK